LDQRAGASLVPTPRVANTDTATRARSSIIAVTVLNVIAVLVLVTAWFAYAICLVAENVWIFGAVSIAGASLWLWLWVIGVRVATSGVIV